jgi:hypothetical protein
VRHYEGMHRKTDIEKKLTHRWQEEICIVRQTLKKTYA